MAITLDGTTGVTASAFDGALGAENLTGDVAAARITDALNAGGSAPIFACRAWVNFDGTGAVAIRASGNVSSITDNGTGDYTVNLTTAMPVTNAALSGAGGLYGNGNFLAVQGPQMRMTSTSAINVICGSDTTTRFDWQEVYVQVFR